MAKRFLLDRPAKQRLWQRLQEAGLPIEWAAHTRVNGEAISASKWVSASDLVIVAGQPLPPPAPRQVYVYHKPVGVDCNVNASQQDSIAQLLTHFPPGTFAVGRLDKDSCGMLLLTNDGQLAQQLLHPSAEHQKTYQVTLNKAFLPSDAARLTAGICYQAGTKHIQARPVQVKIISATTLELVLAEGKNRQIRYMLKTLGYRVLHLQRVAIGQLSLHQLPVGCWRALDRTDLQLLRSPIEPPQLVHTATNE